MNPDPDRLILVINHNQRNLELLTQLLESQGYQVLPALCLETVDQALSGSHTIRLALVDIAGFDSRIWERCQQMRQQQIPFVIISPRQQAAVQQASMLSGALSLLVKPLVMRDLLRLLQNFLEGEE